VITFTKLKKTGQWAVRGLASEMKVGKVSVTRKDGGIEMQDIKSLSKVFESDDGEQYVLGFLEDRSVKKEEPDPNGKKFKKSLTASAEKLPAKQPDKVQALVDAARTAVNLLKGLGLSYKPLEDALKAFTK